MNRRYMIAVRYTDGTTQRFEVVSGNEKEALIDIETQIKTTGKDYISMVVEL